MLDILGLIAQVLDIRHSGNHPLELYTIFNFCTEQGNFGNVMPPHPPNRAILGQGRDLTNENMNCPYSGADPVIKSLQKDGRLLQIWQIQFNYAVWGNQIPDHWKTIFS